MVDTERRAVAVAFLALGSVTGTFASRLPWISDKLHLSSGRLGIDLFMLAVGGMLAMPFAGRFVHRLGTKTTTRVLMVSSCSALALVAWAPNMILLGAAMGLIGASSGTSDMAINTQGIVVEQRLGRSVMSGLHGMWSVGVLISASIGSLAAHAHVDARVQFGVMAPIIAAVAFVAAGWFTGAPAPADGTDGTGGADGTDGTGGEAVPRFVLPRGRILLIGLVGFCAIFGEIGANDWSAVYMHRTIHSSEAGAALATSLFALTMAVGRLVGDHVVRRFGAAATVRTCGVLGGAGGVLVVVSHAAIPAIAGFMLIGVGVSVVVPLVFAAAGHAAPNAAIGIAGVATISYGAGLAAPGIIGGIADATSLRIAFAVVAVLTGLVAVGAGVLAPRPSSQPSGDPADVEGDLLVVA